MKKFIQTFLFLVISAIVFILPYRNFGAQWEIVLVYAAYICLFIKLFKQIALRFLVYPLIVLNLSWGIYYFNSWGLSTSNAVGLGYVFMFYLMFIGIPIMGIASILGGVFDILELIKLMKNNSQQELEENFQDFE